MREIVDELLEWLRIPSVSSGGGDPVALRQAAEWVVERVTDAGGSATLVETGGAPLALGELAAARAGAPTVLIYGHYDVQGPGPLEQWRSAPFEPEIRDGRIWARGAADDKGNFLPLLHETCALARAGALPVNVRILVEGEEEVGSTRVCEWVRADERGADCAIVFDSTMVDERTPALVVACRGLVAARLRVRTAGRDVHSGLYGGAALDAVLALHRMLGAVVPGPDGRLRPELRAGIAPPSEAELAAWRALPSGAEMLAEAGARPADERAAEEFWLRTGAEASLDVNGIAGGDPDQLRTIVPAEARANVSIRLAPGQRGATIASALERLLREAAPAGAEVELAINMAEPAAFDPSLPALRAAHRALRRASGSDVVVVRSGGTLPILSALAERRIPTVITGFALPGDQIHAPNESYRLEGLELGRRAARELYAELAALDEAVAGG